MVAPAAFVTCPFAEMTMPPTPVPMIKPELVTVLPPAPEMPYSLPEMMPLTGFDSEAPEVRDRPIIPIEWLQNWLPDTWSALPISQRGTRNVTGVTFSILPPLLCRSI